MYIQAPNKTDEKHLAEVIDTMRELGAPEIRCYYDGEIGLEPIIVELELDDKIDHDMDVDNDISTVAELVEYLGGITLGIGKCYNIGEFSLDCR